MKHINTEIKLAILLFFIITNITFSQSKNILFRKSVEKQKSVRTTESMQEVEIDTTLLVENSKNLDFLNDYQYFDNEALFDNYIISVFSRKNAVIQQFIVPIIIYLEPEIPDNISIEYKRFVNNIPKIENLQISFTKNKNEANYLLSISEKDFYGISKKELDKFDDQDHDKMVFLKMTFTLFNDQNINAYAYNLKISPSILTEKMTINKLKKAFFMSLGNFNMLSHGAPKGSALDFETTEINELIEEDIQVLKMHYHHIYNYKVDVNNFYQLKYKQDKN